MTKNRVYDDDGVSNGRCRGLYVCCDAFFLLLWNVVAFMLWNTANI